MTWANAGQFGGEQTLGTLIATAPLFTASVPDLLPGSSAATSARFPLQRGMDHVRPEALPLRIALEQLCLTIPR